ncbi:hypothetical protein EYR36_002279 [Pleurotus pulmonarius]|nr:hypothetical protein EYR36_002279 [Pleurotus pulmonarius]
MAILVTGAGGKTSKAVIPQLQDAGIPFIVGSTRGASASSPGIDAVKFDWTDKSTYPIPFQHEFPNGEKITAVYIVPGPVAEPSPAINAFVDYAMKEQGVKRFVMCAGETLKKGGPFVGEVWSHFEEVGAEYMVLRPTWFLENYLDWFYLPLKNENKIYTAAGESTMAFVSAEDIAALAIKGLTAETPFNRDFAVHGPELVTHDQLAEKFSKALGRKIEHVNVTEEKRAAMLTDAGFPAGFAQFMAWLEAHAQSKVRKLRVSNGLKDTLDPRLGIVNRTGMQNCVVYMCPGSRCFAPLPSDHRISVGQQQDRGRVTHGPGFLSLLQLCLPRLLWPPSGRIPHPDSSMSPSDLLSSSNGLRTLLPRRTIPPPHPRVNTALAATTTASK